MAAIDDLIAQVEENNLRQRLKEETARITKQKNFGLVFEDHLPELTPDYEAKILPGKNVCLKSKSPSKLWRVINIKDSKNAICINPTDNTKKTIPIDDLVVVKKFGEPIYPTLTPLDRVQNGAANGPWHSLIEGDNYHALQLLQYLYPKDVDCIYIDPPYNSGGQKDWKYNNNYVDASDNYRHSKWLAMMRRRLLLAKSLLKDDGVLIIAIDENEHAHLICLLENEFPEYESTSVSVVHNPRGNRENNFTVTNEFAVYVIKRGVSTLAKSTVTNSSPRKMRRWGHFSRREERKHSFYPIYVKNNQIIKIGEVPEDSFHPTSRNVSIGNGVTEIWPIDDDMIERRWNYGLDTIQDHLERIVVLQKQGGDLDLFITDELSQPKTVWVSPELDSGGKHGSTLVESITGKKFPYPKSLYTVVRAIDCVVRNKPNALILDFFAGSGTSLHATNLINQRDNGSRRCIMVTNNEVSAKEADEFRKKGWRPGQKEWEENGICRSITWSRSKYSILGRRNDGSPLEGEYMTGTHITDEKPRKCHLISFTSIENLNTLSKKKQLLSLLEGIPQSKVNKDSKFIVDDELKATILFDDASVNDWIEALSDKEHIEDFYIVTTSNVLFKDTKAKIHSLLGPITVTRELSKPLSDGFKANLEYFKINFLDKNLIELGCKFTEILPLLWLRSGALGPRPEIAHSDEEPAYLFPSNSNFAVLINESKFAEFNKIHKKSQGLTHIYLVTNSEDAFQEMASELDTDVVVQLYRDYLENFVINKGVTA